MSHSYLADRAAVDHKLTGTQLRAVAIILQKLTGTPRYHYVTASLAGVICGISRQRARIVLAAMRRKGLIKIQIGSGSHPDRYMLRAHAQRAK